MSGERPALAVVIVTRDRPRELRRCLESIAAQSPPPGETIIVAGSDGSCPDEILQPFTALQPLVIACHEHNISASRNAGLGASGAELVLFIDDDATARPGWIEAYLGAFSRSPSAWAVGGHAMDSRCDPPVPEFAFGLIAPSGLQIEVRRPCESGVPRGYRPNVKGCNFAVRREPVMAVGGFDPFFAFAFDEADLMLSIAAAGGRVVHEPRAVVDHAHAPGHFRRSGPFDRDWRTEYASHTMFMLKHSRGGWGRLRGWFVLARRWVKLAVRLGLAVARGRVRPERVAGIMREAIDGARQGRSAHRGRGSRLRA